MNSSVPPSHSDEESTADDRRPGFRRLPVAIVLGGTVLAVACVLLWPRSTEAPPVIGTAAGVAADASPSTGIEGERDAPATPEQIAFLTRQLREFAESPGRTAADVLLAARAAGFPRVAVPGVEGLAALPVTERAGVLADHSAIGRGFAALADRALDEAIALDHAERELDGIALLQDLRRFLVANGGEDASPAVMTIVATAVRRIESALGDDVDTEIDPAAVFQRQAAGSGGADGADVDGESDADADVDADTSTGEDADAAGGVSR